MGCGLLHTGESFKYGRVGLRCSQGVDVGISERQESILSMSYCHSVMFPDQTGWKGLDVTDGGMFRKLNQSLVVERRWDNMMALVKLKELAGCRGDSGYINCRDHVRLSPHYWPNFLHAWCIVGIFSVMHLSEFLPPDGPTKIVILYSTHFSNGSILLANTDHLKTLK